MCVCVCVSQWKDEWQARQAKSGILQVSSSKRSAKTKQNKSKTPVSSIDHCHSYRRKEKKQFTKPEHVEVHLFRDLCVRACVRVCLYWSFFSFFLYQLSTNLCNISLQILPDLVSFHERPHWTQASFQCLVETNISFSSQTFDTIFSLRGLRKDRSITESVRKQFCFGLLLVHQRPYFNRQSTSTIWDCDAQRHQGEALTTA